MYNVLDWLEGSAERCPQKVAVADVSQRLTFRELRQTARTMGTWISQRVEQREAVALYLEKSAPALAAMLGAVYAGCFYSVLDVRQPASRIRAICEGLHPGVVLTDEANLDAARHVLEGTIWEPVTIESLVQLKIEGSDDDELLAQRRAQTIDADPLYVNFTSGSTGTPKGVVVSHRSVIDFIDVFTRTFGIDQSDVVANQAPFDFDVSVKDIYSCLAIGATLQIVPRAYFSEPVKLMDLLCECEATTLVWAVSAMCFVSIMNAFDYRTPATIRRVLFSGEVMPPKQLRIWRTHLPKATFVNLYGPTEITCNCTYHVVEHDYADDEVIPMGKPFPNERVFLLDEGGAPVTEPDALGEVCVSGTAVGLGYLGDPDRTAAHFTQNPINDRWLEPVYRTGDLARYDENGDLVYAGRRDHQIKHLGQRIELGDVEAAAHAAPGVDRAACLYDARRKKLVLVYAGMSEKDALVDHLRQTLPNFMVPGKTVRVESMPLTKNGKIDRTALNDVAGIRA